MLKRKEYIEAVIRVNDGATKTQLLILFVWVGVLLALEVCTFWMKFSEEYNPDGKYSPLIVIAGIYFICTAGILLIKVRKAFKKRKELTNFAEKQIKELGIRFRR